MLPLVVLLVMSLVVFDCDYDDDCDCDADRLMSMFDDVDVGFDADA